RVLLSVLSQLLLSLFFSRRTAYIRIFTRLEHNNLSFFFLVKNIVQSFIIVFISYFHPFIDFRIFFIINDRRNFTLLFIIASRFRKDNDVFKKTVTLRFYNRQRIDNATVQHIASSIFNCISKKWNGTGGPQQFPERFLIVVFFIKVHRLTRFTIRRNDNELIRTRYNFINIERYYFIRYFIEN